MNVTGDLPALGISEMWSLAHFHALASHSLFI